MQISIPKTAECDDWNQPSLRNSIRGVKASLFKHERSMHKMTVRSHDSGLDLISQIMKMPDAEEESRVDTRGS